ncbi:MAG TPA: hypothetical protein PLP05_02680 [Sedimentisphaerales bacterium]|nr:hypothetical protein [Sedimentisphaerales bacterium]
MTSKNKCIIITICLLCLSFTGCGPNSKKMASKSIALENQHPFSVKVDVIGWEKFDKLQTSGLKNETYAETLTKTIDNTMLFNKVITSGDANYKLKVTVLDHVLPGHVIDYDLKLKTQWDLIDTAADKIVWTDTIDSAYTSKIADDIVTFDRLQKANENVVKINIEEGIKRLSHLKL